MDETTKTAIDPNDVPMDILYRINDGLSALASELGFGFWNEQSEDQFGDTLNEATHAVARIFYANDNN